MRISDWSSDVCSSDLVLLEVVAERPVAEHLEKGVVARGVADLVEVVVLAAGTQAALDIGRAHVAALLRAKEHVLELDHARVDRKSVVSGKSVSVRVDLGGRRIIKKKR